MTAPNLITEVARLLTESGLEAWVEYPGYIRTDDWSIGTANGPWQADLMETVNGEVLTTRTVAGSDQWTDAKQIADALRWLIA